METLPTSFQAFFPSKQVNTNLTQGLYTSLMRETSFLETTAPLLFAIGKTITEKENL